MPIKLYELRKKYLSYGIDSMLPSEVIDLINETQDQLSILQAQVNSGLPCSSHGIGLKCCMRGCHLECGKTPCNIVHP
jgi:hypothetical protein